ncbi:MULTISPECIES: hypothetical protein [unclassified Crossiella]|uniref:hypothetical protein n=1 Tax=unclassified Crossiella TaxID=2620835 RepID=UPI001FFF0598|nr:MULTISPECIES: hypothetical protein [unclassified Crossiella]MCK2242304.1 hypothetical protein [Crossiella sp. S99.2]MCK2254665.1 hypothetical protein [Crossiella sp. S99.1]
MNEWVFALLTFVPGVFLGWIIRDMWPGRRTAEETADRDTDESPRRTPDRPDSWSAAALVAAEAKHNVSRHAAAPVRARHSCHCPRPAECSHRKVTELDPPDEAEETEQALPEAA